MLYYVVMCTPVGNIDMMAEYTGTYYQTRSEAIEELHKAIADVNVGTTWIEKRTKDLNLEYKEA